MFSVGSFLAAILFLSIFPIMLAIALAIVYSDARKRTTVTRMPFVLAAALVVSGLASAWLAWHSGSITVDCGQACVTPVTGADKLLAAILLVIWGGFGTVGMVLSQRLPKA